MEYSILFSKCLQKSIEIKKYRYLNLKFRNWYSIDTLSIQFKSFNLI